jgi:hypothetical protein
MTLASHSKPRSRLQFFSALIPSLKIIESIPSRVRHPLVRSVRCLTVAKRGLEPAAVNWKLFRRVPGFKPDFRTSVDAHQPIARQRMTWQEEQADSLVNQIVAYDWMYTLADNDPPKVRQATELANVSIGYPLLGRELTDFSLSLPPEWKVKGIT